jgi:hypothetical protein
MYSLGVTTIPLLKIPKKKVCGTVFLDTHGEIE